MTHGSLQLGLTESARGISTWRQTYLLLLPQFLGFDSSMSLGNLLSLGRLPRQLETTIARESAYLLLLFALL
jgi:hypothetical protein